jgi:hypothetical protein
MRRATVSKYPGSKWWIVALLTPGHRWEMAAHTWPAAMRIADRWTRGLHATGSES